jgi:hypothetical protein
MVTIAELMRMLAIENNLILSQAEGLSPADMLLQPQPSGNCMNWVLGHILDSQIEMLQILGKPSPLPGLDLTLYKRESQRLVQDGPGVLNPETLLDGLTAVHKALLAALAESGEGDFAREIVSNGRTFSLGWRLFFLQFHYTYHIGQLELLRQLSGRTDKIV